MVPRRVSGLSVKALVVEEFAWVGARSQAICLIGPAMAEGLVVDRACYAPVHERNGCVDRSTVS
jgi:hypothetical protein